MVNEHAERKAAIPQHTVDRRERLHGRDNDLHSASVEGALPLHAHVRAVVRSVMTADNIEGFAAQGDCRRVLRAGAHRRDDRRGGIGLRETLPGRSEVKHVENDQLAAAHEHFGR